MELDFQIDTSWCPSCNRQILPKRYLVPVPQVDAPVPTAPISPEPVSPTRKTSPDAPAARQPKKTGAGRARGGLVHGTGRVKPNGTIKRTDSTQSKKSVEAVKPVLPLKTRTVIDQGPTPLYCSDECRLVDLNASIGVFAGDFDPERETAPGPYHSISSLSISPTSETDSASSDSVSEPPSASFLSHAALAPFYGFPPLPPAPRVSHRTSSLDQCSPTNDYQSGVMMAAQRIKAALCPEPPKRTGFGPHPPVSKERKPIPGWTDGSDAWRASVYSFAAPRDLSIPSSELEHDDRRAYKSFVAASQRQGGVYSTLDAAYHAPSTSNNSPSKPIPRNRTVDELYTKYPLAISRRVTSRSSMSTSPVGGQARSLPTSIGPIVRKTKEVPLLKRGAEGKLLVPDVKLKVSTSYVSVTGSTSSTSRSSRLTRRDSDRSETSLTSVSESTEDTPCYFGLGRPRRNPEETRSWSYDNLKTYPVMQLPPKKEKRIEQRVINGVEQDVEVEVELPPTPLKRLFLFPGKSGT